MHASFIWLGCKTCKPLSFQGCSSLLTATSNALKNFSGSTTPSLDNLRDQADLHGRRLEELLTKQTDFAAAAASSMENFNLRSSEMAGALERMGNQEILTQETRSETFKSFTNDISTKISNNVPMMSAEQSQLMQGLFHRIEDLIKTRLLLKMDKPRMRRRVRWHKRWSATHGQSFAI